jgi:hypothetical protein
MQHSARLTVMGGNPPRERTRNTAAPALDGTTFEFVIICDFMLGEFSLIPRMLTVR